MRFCSVILFYFSFNYIFFNGDTRYLLVEIDAGKEKQEGPRKYWKNKIGVQQMLGYCQFNICPLRNDNKNLNYQCR